MERTIDERAMRRDEFTEGPAFVGRDGQHWHLPILDEITISNCQGFGLFVRRNLKRNPMADGMLNLYERIRLILLEMLYQNYDLSLEQAEEIVGTETGLASDFTTIMSGQAALLQSLQRMHGYVRNCLYTDYRYN